MNKNRFKAAGIAARYHLLLSALIVGTSAALAVYFWYPAPFTELSGGFQILTLILIVDIVCGPILTFIVFSPSKSRREIFTDLTIIGIVQLAALTYGLSSMMLARPVFIAYEGDRFRVVAEADVDPTKLRDAPPDLQKLSLTGPKPLGVRLAIGSDPDFRDSIVLSLEGLPPSFRPSRWVPFNSQRESILSAATPLTNLYKRYPNKKMMLDQKVSEINLKISDLGYMPLAAGSSLDWSVLLDLRSGDIVGYVHLDAWPD